MMVAEGESKSVFQLVLPAETRWTSGGPPADVYYLLYTKLSHKALYYSLFLLPPNDSKSSLSYKTTVTLRLPMPSTFCEWKEMLLMRETCPDLGTPRDVGIGVSLTGSGSRT
jgi:hypothetical protein